MQRVVSYRQEHSWVCLQMPYGISQGSNQSNGHDWGDESVSRSLRQLTRHGPSINLLPPRVVTGQMCQGQGLEVESRGRGQACRIASAKLREENKWVTANEIEMLCLIHFLAYKLFLHYYSLSGNDSFYKRIYSGCFQLVMINLVGFGIWAFDKRESMVT